MRSKLGRLLGTGLVMGMVVLAGCGHAPTAPVIENSGAATLREAPSHGAISQERQDPSVALDNPVLSRPQTAGPQAIATSVQIHGKDGGDVTLAGVTVHVPANAFKGNATLTLTIPDAARPECELAVSPPSKDKFSVPAMISFNAAAIADVRAMVVYEFDAGEGMWMPLPCSVNAQGKVLAAQIFHGSKYKADTEAVRRSAR